MERGVRYHVGGIHSLLELHSKHSEALEADLIALGLRWRDLPSDRFNWRDLYAIVAASPHTSALYRARNPDRATWDATTFTLADLIDQAKVTNFKLAQLLGQHPRKPKPYPRPGVTPDGVQHFRSKPVPLSVLRERLGRNKST